MIVTGFNRVELIVAEDLIANAVSQFNDLLGLNLPEAHQIAGHPVLSATDFDGHIELVAPIGGEGHFGALLARNGPGQIGPLVFEIDDVGEARSWVTARGLSVLFEYDSRNGNEHEQAQPVHQLVLDPAEWFGFTVTLMKRFREHEVEDAAREVASS